MRLQSLKTIASEDRNSSVDVFRAVAITTVVLFHFKHVLPYGYLGVGLFFVISGLLVGGILTKQYKAGEKINFFHFILQRGFKIWPSFYIFLLVGNIAAYILLHSFAPQEYIPLSEIGKYAFFYMNYDVPDNHWAFGQEWSLCVEEHFYIFLPLIFILIQRFIRHKAALFVATGLLIATGILSKAIAFWLNPENDTYFATQNRVDALGWGVLLTLIIAHRPGFVKKISRYFILAAFGAIFFLTVLYIDRHTTSGFYHKVLFHTLVPFSFFLMLTGTYYSNFSRFKILRFVSYYSYNWYLWHPITAVTVLHYVGNGYAGLAVYLISSFLIAVLFTVLVEEPFLRLRRRVVGKLFKKKPAPVAVAENTVIAVETLSFKEVKAPV